MGFMLLGVVLVAVLVWFAVQASRWAAARSEVDAHLAQPTVETLDYVVPEGQDPAVVVAALQKNGFEAAPDIGAKQRLHVATGDVQREQVRSIIQSIGSTALEDGAPVDAGVVRFEDER
jgi:hypothetical protein